MTYRIYPTTDGRWRFGIRVYETLIEARRALTQTSRRLHRKRRAAVALAHIRLGSFSSCERNETAAILYSQDTNRCRQ